MSNVRLIGNDSELLGGWLRDAINRSPLHKRLAARLAKMPKWKRILLVGCGLGLVSPTLGVTALTTGAVVGGTAVALATAVALPTALAAAPVAATIFGARKLRKTIQARIAAKQAAGQDTSADQQQLAQVSEVANQQIPPNAPQTEAAANAQTTALENQHGDAASKNKTVALVAGGVGLLTLLPMLMKK